MSYVRSASLTAALEAREAHPDFVPLAGATDLMVGAVKKPGLPGVIDLGEVSELVGITVSDDEIQIGAATPYVQILDHAAVASTLPMLHRCVREIGAAQIQHRGTMGGNIATSSPVGDTLPVLLALNASIEVASTRGARTIAYDDFCTGYRQTALRPDELLVAITIPTPHPDTRQFWRKVGTRGAQSIAKVSVAMSAVIAEDEVATCRLAMGAVAATPIRLVEVEKLIIGETVDETLAARAAAAVEAAITPIDDVRSSAFYRRKVAANITRRFVLSLM